MKPGGLVIEFGKGKPPAEEEGGDKEPADMESSESEDFDASAAQAFDALKNGDVEGFKLALKAAVMCCGDD